MDNHTTFDSSEPVFLKKRVAELEAREVQLQKDHECLKQLYERAPLSYHSLDGNGCFIAVNQAWLDTLGYTREEVIGKNFSEFLHPDRQNHFKEIYSRFKGIGEVLGVEFEMLRKDGTTILVSCCGRIGKDSEGCFQQTHCIFQDITERKKAEEALGESEARMRAITDSARDGMVMADQNGDISYWNPAAERIFGYTSDETIGRNLHRLIAPQRYHESHDTAFAEFQRTGQGRAVDSTLELKARHKNGHEISVELSLSALRLQDGWHSIGIIRDITERKRAEQRLRESEERFRVLHNASFGGIGIHDQGIILDCNQGLSDLTGYSIEELIGMDGLRLFAPDWRELVMQNIRSGFEQAYEAEGLRKDGTRYPLAVRGSSIPFKGRTARVAELRDITEQKRGEEERKHLQARLIQAQKMEAIGTLAGGIAHDFNNILGAILGYAELARNASPSGSSAIKYLDKELQAVHRAIMLVKQILAFSRQGEAERVPLQLADHIKEAINLLRSTLPTTITIKHQIDNAAKYILADPTQIHQILINICTNAFHAMEQAGGTIEITLKDSEISREDYPQHTELQSGNFVVLSIRDTGSGIAPIIKNKIFDPYFTTKETGRGTGMGLSIVHGIVKSYGGFITIDSKLGEGTVFRIYFPAIQQEAAPEIMTARTISVGKERILLIDDEDILAEMGKAMLESLGYEVTALTSSMEALTIFQNHSELFDVVITDQTMPGMTGMDLARRMLEIRPEMPIILCTGYSTLITEEEAKAHGIREFLMKPLAMKEIATLLRKILDEGSTAKTDFLLM